MGLGSQEPNHRLSIVISRSSSIAEVGDILEIIIRNLLEGLQRHCLHQALTLQIV